MFKSVEPLFKPKTVAIVGATETGGAGWPRAIFRNLEHAGFPARTYLINPRRDRLWDHDVYPSFEALPEPVDLALVVIPAEQVVETLQAGRAHGLKAALVYAARFGEGDDEEGARRADALRALCADGLRVTGPNCMGALALREGNLFYPAERVRGLPTGSLGVVFQSGGTFQYWLTQAAVRGLGFTYAVSSGNELDLDAADYISFMVDDPETRVIACMLEGVRRPEAFMAAAARALDAGKPLLVVKTGTSEGGRASTESHTGAIAGDDAVFDAVCERYGIVRCYGLDDMIEAALTFTMARPPAGARVAFAGFSGGAVGLFLDYASDAALPLAALGEETKTAIEERLPQGTEAANPLDGGAGLAGRPQIFKEICTLIANDPGVDILSMQGQLPISETDPASPEVFSEVAATGKCVVAHGRMGQNVTDAGRAFQDAAGVPFVQGLPETVRVLKGLGAYAQRRRKGLLPAKAKDRPASEGALGALLEQAGLPAPRGAFAENADAAAARAQENGYPVALKLVSPAARHKTEVGGVALGLQDADAVRRAAGEMAAKLERAIPGAPIEGFLIQEMVSGPELILGVREDPQFGPFIVAGLGGVQVEILGDLAFRLLPIDCEDAHAMLASLKCYPLLGAFRGRPPRDVDALVGAMVGLGELFMAVRARYTDIEINPVIALAEGEGVRAVDIREVERT